MLDYANRREDSGTESRFQIEKAYRMQPKLEVADESAGDSLAGYQSRYFGNSTVNQSTETINNKTKEIKHLDGNFRNKRYTLNKDLSFEQSKKSIHLNRQPLLLSMYDYRPIEDIKFDVVSTHK